MGSDPALCLGLLTLRWFSQIELTYSSPFVYTIWGVLIWSFAPKIQSLWMLLTAAVMLRLGCVGAELYGLMTHIGIFERTGCTQRLQSV